MIDDDELQAQRASIETEAKSVPLDQMRVAAALLQNFEAVLQKATAEEQQLLFRQLIRKIFIRDRRIVLIQPTPVLWGILAQGIPQTGPTGVYRLRGMVFASPELTFEQIKEIEAA